MAKLQNLPSNKNTPGPGVWRWIFFDENSGGAEETTKVGDTNWFFGSSPKYVEKSLEPGEVFHVTNWLIQRFLLLNLKMCVVQ